MRVRSSKKSVRDRKHRKLYVATVRLHDLRHSFASAGLLQRLKPEIEIDGALGFGEDDAVELAEESDDDR